MNKQLLPKWQIEQAIQIGKEALVLISGRERALAPRLTEGILENLPNDVSLLENLLMGRPAKNIEVKGMTAREAELSLEGAFWIGAVREAVKKRMPGSALAKAVGVGEAINNRRSASVASAIEAILKAAGENPEEILSCGILEDDILNGRTILDSLVGARLAQDTGMKSKKTLTTEKNVIQIRIEKAVKEISTAGYIQYMNSEPVIARRFKELTPTTRRRKDAAPPVPVTLPKKETPVLEKLN